MVRRRKGDNSYYDLQFPLQKVCKHFKAAMITCVLAFLLIELMILGEGLQ